MKFDVPERASSSPAATADSSVFALEDVAVFYTDFKAVRDVNLTIAKNEITAFIGPSGCGKTTVLRSLNRMNDLIPGARVEGTVRYRGIDLYAEGVSATQVRHHIGMVFQKPNPFPKSIYDNVAFGPRVHGVKKKSELDAIVGKVTPWRCSVGRGEGPYEHISARYVRRSTAAALHCSHHCGGARCRAYG